MSEGTTNDMVSVESVADEKTVGRVNKFFNSKTVKSELNRFTYRPTLDRAFEREDRRLFYVEINREISGALMVWCESKVLDPMEAQIRLIAVHPQHRNLGIGRKLCERAEEFASTSGMGKMSADVAEDSSSIGFWKTCGYEKVSTWITESGREMCRVVKSLT